MNKGLANGLAELLQEADIVEMKCRVCQQQGMVVIKCPDRYVFGCTSCQTFSKGEWIN